jgi:hypothetical protein
MKVNTSVILVVAISLGFLGRAHATDGDVQSHAKDLQSLAHQTKNVWVGQLQGSIESFVPDDDSMTVQIVMAPCDKAKQSYMSEDGQVIFVCPGDSGGDRLQSLLIQSLERRLAILKSST